MDRARNGDVKASKMPWTGIKAFITNFSGSGGRMLAVRLEPGQAFALPGDRRGGRLVSLQGNLWVTQQGDAADYLLQPGESFTITRRGKVVVQGLREARLGYVPARRG